MLIRPGRCTDLPAVAALLDAAGLPAEDLEGSLSTLLVGESRGQVVVAGALQPLGRHVLLRSIVVAPSHRGRGWGARMTRRLLDLAARMGFGEAWLLTRDAQTFFGGLGFAVAARGDAPPLVRTAPLFTTHCPAEAVLMRRALAMLPAGAS